MNQTAPQAPAASAKPAGKKEERANVLKFNLAGYIVVDAKKPTTITKACTDFSAAVDALKKAGATITRDEEPQFTTVNTKTGEE